MFRFAESVKCAVEVTERTGVPTPSKCPYIKIKDDRTYEVECDSIEQFLFRML